MLRQNVQNDVKTSLNIRENNRSFWNLSAESREDKRYQCQLCKKEFAEQHHLRRHADSHACKACGEVFLTLALVRDHRKNACKNSKSNKKSQLDELVCKICDHIEYEYKRLARHIANQNVDVVAQYAKETCPICAKTLKTYNCMNAHMRTVHGLQFYDYVQQQYVKPEPT